MDVADVSVRAVGGVGTCSGGPLRSALGWLEQPLLISGASVAVKAWLLLMQ